LSIGELRLFWAAKPGTALAFPALMFSAFCRCALVAAVLAIALPPRAAGSSLAAGQQHEGTVAEAWAALQRGDAAAAASIFRQHLERRPTDPQLHYGAGIAAYELGRTDAALSSLKKAIELDPTFVAALTTLAQVAYNGGDLDVAIRSLEKASALSPGDGGIAQQLERWRRESSVHSSMAEKPGVRFRILYEGAAQQAIGERVSRVLERAYWSIGKTLNSYPTETLTVILYTNRQFQDITRAPAWAGGGYDGRIRVAVGGALRSPRELDRVVTHELVHAVVGSAAPRNVPAWINEGLASYLESNDHAWARQVIRSAGTVFPLDDLANGFGGLDGASALVAYAESEIAAEILCETLGPNIGVFLQMIGNGDPLDQALLAVRVQPEAFRAEWRRRIGVR
jgi:tetratricopeptide (TPR) repeat protein